MSGGNNYKQFCPDIGKLQKVNSLATCGVLVAGDLAALSLAPS